MSDRIKEARQNVQEARRLVQEGGLNIPIRAVQLLCGSIELLIDQIVEERTSVRTDGSEG